MGATFSPKKYWWSNGVSKIYVEGPSSKIDEMAVMYSLDSLQRQVSTLIDAKKCSLIKK